MASAPNRAGAGPVEETGRKLGAGGGPGRALGGGGRVVAKYLLGIDEGTTGCRADLFDFEGERVSGAYLEYPSYFPHPGWVEQSANDITRAMYATVRSTISRGNVNPHEIVALGIATQAYVLGPLDQQGSLLRPFIGWQDLRGSEYIESIQRDRIGKAEYYRLSGAPLNAMLGITKLAWFRDHEAELYQRTAVFSDHQAFFLRAFGVTGGYFTDLSSASRSGMLDVDKHRWSERIFEALDMDVARFPTIVLDTPVVGEVGRRVADATGLAEGTRVVVAGHDQNCSSFGSGVVDAGVAAVVLGTGGSCYVAVGTPVRDPRGVLMVKANVGVRNWTIGGAATAAASSYRWFRDTFGSLEVAMGGVLQRDPYELIGMEAETAPPGANGLTFLPYLQGATAGPRANAQARGVLAGLTLGTSRADVARGIMEGITLEIRDIVEAVHAARVEIETIRATGGATKSRLWNQMQADIYKRPVQVLKERDTGALGAALYAGVGVGVYGSYREAVATAVRVAEEYEPNAKVFDAYDDAYGRFLRCYEGLFGSGVF